MDECDVTSERMAIEERQRIEDHRLKMANRRVTDDCEECGVRIPAARQNATGGTDMCIDCQSELEKLNIHMGGL